MNYERVYNAIIEKRRLNPLTKNERRRKTPY